MGYRVLLHALFECVFVCVCIIGVVVCFCVYVLLLFDVVVCFDCDSMCGVVWLACCVRLCAMCVFACVVHSFV